MSSFIPFIIKISHVGLVLITLDSNKANESDQLVIIECSFAPSITYLFNLSLSTNVFPSIWKIVHIVPVHKTGDNNIIKTTDHILPIISKEFEKCYTHDQSSVF